jgi:hypothetical protein
MKRTAEAHVVEVDAAGLRWIKSSLSGGHVDKQACVEVAPQAQEVFVRTSRDRSGGRLAFSRGSWNLFLLSVKNL